MKNTILYDKAFDFAIDVVFLYQDLKNDKHFEIASQILRSGTSISANLHECTAAISRKDFIAKVSIASKEARETLFWLRLIEKTQIIDRDLSKMILLADELVKMTTASVKTAQKNLKKGYSKINNK